MLKKQEIQESRGDEQRKKIGCAITKALSFIFHDQNIEKISLMRQTDYSRKAHGVDQNKTIVTRQYKKISNLSRPMAARQVFS